MLQHFRKAFILAIAILVVMWAYKQLKDDIKSNELVSQLKKIINGKV